MNKFNKEVYENVVTVKFSESQLSGIIDVSNDTKLNRSEILRMALDDLLRTYSSQKDNK